MPTVPRHIQSCLAAMGGEQSTCQWQQMGGHSGAFQLPTLSHHPSSSRLAAGGTHNSPSLPPCLPGETFYTTEALINLKLCHIKFVSLREMVTSEILL